MNARRRTHLVVGVGCLIAALSAANTSAAAPPQRGGRGGGGGGAPAYEAARLETLETDFKLTKDQKKAVKTILDDAHKAAAPIRESLISTRSSIAAAIQTNKSQADIDAAVAEYARQAAAMTTLEMKSLAQVLQALEPEQRANQAALRSAFFLMRGAFLHKKWDEVPDLRGY